jgi:hypothetical protein
MMETVLTVLFVVGFLAVAKMLHNRSRIGRWGRELKFAQEFMPELSTQGATQGLMPAVVDQQVVPKMGTDLHTIFASWRLDPADPATEFARVWIDNQSQRLHFQSPYLPDEIVATSRPPSRRRYRVPSDEQRQSRIMMYLTAVMLAWQAFSAAQAHEPPPVQAKSKSRRKGGGGSDTSGDEHRPTMRLVRSTITTPEVTPAMMSLRVSKAIRLSTRLPN